MLARLDSCFCRNDEGLSAAMEPKFWDFAENDAVFCIMRHPQKQESRIIFDWIPVFTGMTTWNASLRTSIKVRFSSSETPFFGRV